MLFHLFCGKLTLTITTTPHHKN